MHMKDLSDLLKPETFEKDEPVGIAAVAVALLPGPIDESNWKYISERLWSRLLCLGAAYQLHFHHVMEPVIDTVLLPEQCESLAKELHFLIDVTTDPALQQAIGVFIQEARTVVNRPHMRLVISPP